jgi:uncharacterized ubiquitin-like protein YukD
MELQLDFKGHADSPAEVMGGIITGAAADVVGGWLVAAAGGKNGEGCLILDPGCGQINSEFRARSRLSHFRTPFRLSISMSNITIEVWDATGNKKQQVELPVGAPINRVIAVLVEKMNLPRHSPDGQLMSYKFHHRASGRQLLDDQTLASADVRDGDILRLQPEITAGARMPGR